MSSLLLVLELIDFDESGYIFSTEHVKEFIVQLLLQAVR
jgi:hypothetical protein